MKAPYVIRKWPTGKGNYLFKLVHVQTGIVVMEIIQTSPIASPAMLKQQAKLNSKAMLDEMGA